MRRNIGAEAWLDEDGQPRENVRVSMDDVIDVEVEELQPRKPKVPAVRTEDARGILIDPFVVRRMASRGAPMAEVANILGISPERLRADPALVENWKRGRDEGRLSLREALFRNAVDNDNVQAQIHLAKQQSWLGHSDRKEITGAEGAPITFAALAAEAVEVIDVQVSPAKEDDPETD